MSNEIKSARNRLRRARDHAEKFNREARDFIQSGAYQVVREAKPEGQDTLVTFTFLVTQPLTDELELTFGDSINQLRSACDNLIVALAVKSGLDKALKPSKMRFLGFPVMLEPRAVAGGGVRHFEGWAKDYPFRADILAFLESLQPYNAYIDGKGSSFVGSMHPLFILNGLWNQDKHRLPLKVTAVNTVHGVLVDVGSPDRSVTWTITVAEDGSTRMSDVEMSEIVVREVDGQTIHRPVVYGGNLASGSIQSGTEYARVTLVKGEPIDNVQAPIAIDIRLDEEAEFAPGALAYKLLVTLHDYVSREFIDKAEGFFA